MPESPAPISAEQLAAALRSELAASAMIVRARVMNRLLHAEPEIFAALLLRPPRNGESPFRRFDKAR